MEQEASGNCLNKSMKGLNERVWLHLRTQSTESAEWGSRGRRGCWSRRVHFPQFSQQRWWLKQFVMKTPERAATIMNGKVKWTIIVMKGLREWKGYEDSWGKIQEERVDLGKCWLLFSEELLWRVNRICQSANHFTWLPVSPTFAFDLFINNLWLAAQPPIHQLFRM
jgi:hypothetical protein